jgi:hypothetical protein
MYSCLFVDVMATPMKMHVLRKQLAASLTIPMDLVLFLIHACLFLRALISGFVRCLWVGFPMVVNVNSSQGAALLDLMGMITALISLQVPTNAIHFV